MTQTDLREFMLIAEHTRKKCRTFMKRRDYFVRIKTELKQLFAEFIDEYAASYQVALEGDNETNWHIQAVIKMKNERQSLRPLIKSWYEKHCLKPKINTYYSCKAIRENALRALAYNMKEDSEPLYKNVNEEDIKIAQQLSHGKDLRQFNKAYEKLKEKYFTDDTYTTTKLTADIILLKAKFNQNLRLNHIEAQVRTIMVRRDPSYAMEWARSIYNNIVNVQREF